MRRDDLPWSRPARPRSIQKASDFDGLKEVQARRPSSRDSLAPFGAFEVHVVTMLDRTSSEACLTLVPQFPQEKEKMAWCRAAPALDTKLKGLYRGGGLEVAESAFPIQVAATEPKRTPPSLGGNGGHCLPR